MSSSRPTTTNTDDPVAENARSNERVPHAEGGGAFGFFEVTEDVSQFTGAAVFQPGTTTETLVRFSSPGIRREPLGTAIRFRTSEGDYDLVGANTPVCAVRDPSDLPGPVPWWPGRADEHLRGNDERWDFWTRHPASAHQVTWLMGDRGLPATWRHTNLHGVHTYLWTNAAGERFWVKYHFRTAQGHEFLSQDTDRPAGADGDHCVRDLRTAVESGEYPEWTLYVQVMPFEDAVDYRFDPFDATKVWPHADHPLIEVGRLVLNRDPDDHFARIEQTVFDPSNTVPGIGASPDRMLRARLFSCSEESPTPFDSGQGDIEQEVVRASSTPHAEDDDFGQAGTLVREVFDDAERARFVDNVAGHLLGGVSRSVLDRALEYWRNVDKATGDRIAEKVGGD